MEVKTKYLIFWFLLASTAALDIVQVAKMIKDERYKQQLLEIPKKITSKIKDLNSKTELTTSYSFPPEYKTTIYKDPDHETVVVNLFPRLETSTQTVQYQTLEFQTLEPSTVFGMKILNSTVEFQETPMLNSTLVYPTTVPVESIGYATQEYQYEILVHPTQVTVSELTSTTVVNFTHIAEVDNNIPLL